MEPASDDQVCMIYRRKPRIVANACLVCNLSLIACQSRGEYQTDRCCDYCVDHDNAHG